MRKFTKTPPSSWQRPAKVALFAAVAVPLLTHCGGSSEGSATDNELLQITTEKAAYVEGVGLNTASNILYVLPEIEDVPVKRLTAQAKALQAKASSDDEVVACGTSGNYTIQRENAVTTITYNQCIDKGIDDEGDAYTDTINGWVRYTTRTALPGYDSTELVEEDTTASLVYDARYNITTRVQTQMVLSQAGTKYRVDDARHTLIDKGTWDGVAFDLTSAAQSMQITVTPNGMEYTGRVGTWGMDYDGNPAMGGMVNTRTTTPLVFGDTDGTVIKAGAVRSEGAKGTQGEVVFSVSGHATSVNGAPVRSGRW